MRYFFDLADGSVERDVSGLELDSVSHARQTAVQRASDALRDRPEYLWANVGMAVLVRNASDLELFRIVIYSLDAPALAV